LNHSSLITDPESLIHESLIVNHSSSNRRIVESREGALDTTIQGFEDPRIRGSKDKGFKDGGFKDGGFKDERFRISD